MIRFWDYFKLRFRENELDVTKQEIFQTDGREINVLGLVHVTVEVGGAVTVQQMYVTLILCRSMILVSDWLPSN